jgi:hypothetical protein
MTAPVATRSHASAGALPYVSVTPIRQCDQQTAAVANMAAQSLRPDREPGQNDAEMLRWVREARVRGRRREFSCPALRWLALVLQYHRRPLSHGPALQVQVRFR